MKKKTLFYYFIILLSFVLILPSVWPLFRSDFFRMHDFTHVARLVELDNAVKDGHIPPRWSRNLGWGYGMPLFHFYAPMPYYLAEFFHLIGFNFVNSIKIIFGLTFFISFFGMFLLARKFWGSLAGFLSGIAFVYSPYRAVDFYIRGALGELFAIALIPWVLWGLTEVIDKKGKRKIGLAGLSLGLFFLSHTVLNLMALPFFILFAFFYWLINRSKRKVLIKVGISFVLGIGLASFFLIPAFFEKKFTSVDKLISGYSHYSHHFLYFRQFLQERWGYGSSIDGPNDSISFSLGKVHLFLVLATWVFVFLKIIFEQKVEKKIYMIAFFTFLTGGLAWLSTYHSKKIWDKISMMAYIQFPWRLNSFIIVLIAFLAGGGAYYLKRFNKKLGFIFIFGAILFLLKTNLLYFKPEKYSNPDDYYYTDKERIQKSMSGIIPDYIPIWVEKGTKEIAASDYEVIAGNPKIEVISSKTHKVVFKVFSDKPSEIQLNKFYFPGWQAFVNKEKTDLTYKENNGIIKTTLPKGSYYFTLKFSRTKIRLLAEIISIVSFLILVFSFFGLPSTIKSKASNIPKAADG